MSIEVKNLRVKIEDKEIVKNINFNINENELVMVLGLNGAGKTTIMKTLVGINKATDGQILFDGEDITKLSISKRGKLMSYIPQSTEPPLKYTVREFVEMGITPHLGIFDMPSKIHDYDVDKALELLKIVDIKDNYLDVISGGEKQLAYLARAIVQKAKFMVLDEPTAYLDFKRQHLFIRELKNFIKETKKGAILTVHDPNIALRYADKIIVIHNKEVLNIIHKKEDYQNEFLNILNKIYDNKLRLISCGKSYMVTWEDEEEMVCLQ